LEYEEERREEEYGEILTIVSEKEENYWRSNREY
jgi:hypothetical protein